MRIATLLKILAVLVVLVIAGIIGVMLTFDANEYKDEIARAVKDATGRELTIAGDIAFEPGFTPSLGVAGVRFANAPWGSRPDMVRLDRLSAEVALVPLFRGDIRITRIVLRGADILLESDGKGRANWLLENGKPATPPAEGESAGGAVIPTVNLVSIEKSRLTWRAGGDARPLVFAIDTLDARARDVASPVLFSAEGALNDNRFAVNGTLGALSKLIAGGAWPFDIAAEAGGAEIKATGAIADPAAVRGIEVTVSAAGKDLAALSGIAGTELPALGPYAFSGKVGQKGAAWRISDLAARLGSSAISGTLLVDPSRKPVRMEATLSAKLIDAADFAGRESNGTRAQTPAATDDGRVFSDAPLPLDELPDLDLAVRIGAGLLRIGKLEASDLAARVTVRGGEVRIRDLAMTFSGGRVGGEAELALAKRSAKANLRLKAANLDIGGLLKRLELTDAVEGAMDVDVQVSGGGGSVRALMAGLNGTTSVVVGEGAIGSRYVNLIGADLLSSLAPWAPEKKGTKVNCLVSRLLIRDGIADSRALLFDTDLVTVGGKGTIDLRTEALALKLVPRPKDASLLSLAAPINITGTLAAPKALPDTVAVATGVAGAVLGSAINPFGILLPLVSSGSGDKNPCIAALAERRAPAQGGAPAPAARPAEPSSPGDSVGDAIKGIGEGIGKGLKSLFGQ